jgi:hypothetical protein
MDIDGTVELVDGPECSFPDCRPECPQDVLTFWMPSRGRFGEEFLAAIRFMADVLPTEIQW